MRMVPLESGCRDRDLYANMLQKMKTHLKGAFVPMQAHHFVHKLVSASRRMAPCRAA